MPKSQASGTSKQATREGARKTAVQKIAKSKAAASEPNQHVQPKGTKRRKDKSEDADDDMDAQGTRSNVLRRWGRLPTTHYRAFIAFSVHLELKGPSLIILLDIIELTKVHTSFCILQTSVC